MCGVLGIRAPERDVARLAYFGLFALQHRGQESAGIAVSDAGRLTALRDMGLVTQVFSEDKLQGLQGDAAIAHCRYSTTGGVHWQNAQPLVQHGSARTVALGHNGNLLNTTELRAELIASGVKLRTTSDTEVIAALVANDERPLEEAVAATMARLEGAYTIVLLAEGKLVGFRDPEGIRPLSIGSLDGDPVLVSETCALDLLGAEFVRDVNPGELVVVDEDGLHGGPGRAGAERRLALHLRVHLLRPAGLEAPRRRAARRARADGRAARRRGAGRGRPRAADPGLRHAGRDRFRARERHPVQRGADQEPLRRADVHPARRDAARARDQDEVQPARRGGRASASWSSTTRSCAGRRRGRSSRCCSRRARPRCTSASRRRRSSPPATTGSTWPRRPS